MENTPEPDKATHSPDYLDCLLNTEQAALFIGFEPRTLNKWRVVGGGPPFIAISNRAVRYRRRDLIAWANEHLRRSTSEPVQPPKV